MSGETERVDAEAVAASLASTRFGSIRWVEETGSTNADLAIEARRGAGEQVLVTDLQTAGRGRRRRTWTAPAGTSVLMSVLLRDDLYPNPFWTIGAVGIAAVEAIGSLTTAPSSLKWPNDVMIGDAKVAGVLAEIVDGSVIVGIGVNVNWAASMVEEIDGRATAINQHLDRPTEAVHLVDRAAFVVDLLHRLEDTLALSVDATQQRWRQHCSTIGRSVRVIRDDVEVVGEAVDVRGDGALLVANDGVVSPHLVGDVTHLRFT